MIKNAPYRKIRVFENRDSCRCPFAAPSAWAAPPAIGLLLWVCAAKTEYAPTARDGCRRRWVHLCFRLLSVTLSVGVIFCRRRPYPRLLKLTGVELCRLSASFFGAFRPFCFDGHCALCIKEGQKPHKNCLLSDASSFDRDDFCSGKAKPAGNTVVFTRALTQHG